MSGLDAERRKDERLDSWKEIAAYLGRGVSTVQRWESEQGMPVHRLPNARRGSVYAYKSELEAWLGGSDRTGAQEHEAVRPQPAAGGVETKSVPPLPAHYVGAGLVTVALVLFFWWPAERATSEPISPTVQGNTPLVREHGSARYPTFSPDGKSLAYAFSAADGDVGVYVKDLPGGTPRHQTPTYRQATAPRWSPDGRWIAFAAELGDAWHQICLLNAQTGEIDELFHLRHGQLGGIYVDWTPDSAALVYANRRAATDPLHIEKYRLLDGAVSALTVPDTHTGGDHYPNVSPDGSRLAFARCAVEDTRCLPYVRDLSSGVEWPVGETRSAIRGMAWLGSVERLVVAANLDGPRRLWLYDLRGMDTVEPQMLTGHLERAYHPAIRKLGPGAGTRIAYELQTSDDNVWRLDLRTIDAAPRPIIELVGHERLPQVSRDGSWLTFVSDVTGGEETWVAAGGGEGAAQLTNLGEQFMGLASWSPDGSRIALASGDALRLYSWPGRQAQPLMLRGMYPTWHSNGAALIAAGQSELVAEQRAVHMLSLDGAEHYQVTPGAAFFGRMGPDDRYLYYTKGRKLPLGLWRVRLDGGAEELVTERVRGTEWDVAYDGIYYLDALGGGGEIRVPLAIRHYRVADGVDAVVREGLVPDAVNIERGFAITWDGRYAYWSQRDRVESSLVEVAVPARQP